jgi:sugar-specific transcriptional regulator TrmB
MKWICAIAIVGMGLFGCDSKPKEATEVPEDLMREIALDAARQTMRTEGMEILSQIKEQIAEQARQEARKVAMLVATDTTNQKIIDECRKLIDQSRLQIEAKITELQKRFENSFSSAQNPEGTVSNSSSNAGSK